VTMYVDRVPLSEAMETLAANVVLPPSDNNTPDRANRPDRPNRPDGGGLGGGAGGPGGGAGGGQGGPPGGGGGFGGGGPGGGRGGFGGGAQWNLGFFVAPTPAQLQNEIRTFESGGTSDDFKVYSSGASLQMLTTENEMDTPDPQKQGWPGYTPPPPPDPAAAPPPPASATTSTNAPPANPAPAAPPAPAPDAPPTVHTYLQAMAETANIWIVVPGAWAPEVASPPSPSSSIIRAVKNLVSGAHGYVTQAIVLRVGWNGIRPPGPGNPDAMIDRMRNEIKGLPADQRADATDALNKEIAFREELKNAPPEKRRGMMFQHRLEAMINGDRDSHLSPEKRAQRYQRLIQAREAAKNGTPMPGPGGGGGPPGGPGGPGSPGQPKPPSK